MRKGSNSLYCHQRSPGRQSKQFQKTPVQTWKMRLRSQHRREDGHGKSKGTTRSLRAWCQLRGKARSSQVGGPQGGLQRLHTQNLGLNRQTRSAHHEPAIARSTSLKQRNRRKQDDHQKPNSKCKCLSQMDIIPQHNRQRVQRLHFR